ncbi:hypothetical protein LINPERPRIM_LOCUS16978 [Linum perenne]
MAKTAFQEIETRPSSGKSNQRTTGSRFLSQNSDSAQTVTPDQVKNPKPPRHNLQFTVPHLDII